MPKMGCVYMIEIANYLPLYNISSYHIYRQIYLTTYVCT
jgi:hypothetical protein